MKILVVDDETLIRDVVREYLQLDGFSVEEARDGDEALDKFQQEQFDLVIMDIMMPKKDGFQTLKEMKQIKDIPVLMLSARGEEFDKLIGFDLGIDDYVTKPFSPKELVARVKAITKRRDANPKRLVFGGLEVDDVAHEVKIDGKLINLTPKEYDLLKYFVSNNHIALSREQLLTNIWGYDFYGDDRTVDTHIKMLRNNLGKYRDLIITVRGIGYKFDDEK